MSANRQSTRRRRRPVERGQSSAVSETSVSVSEKIGSDDPVEVEQSTTHEAVQVHSDTPAYVRISGGRTINMGDFESLRIDIAIEMPCEPTKEAVVAKYTEVTETLDQLMTDRIPS